MVGLQLASGPVHELVIQSRIVLEETLAQPSGKFDGKALRALALMPVGRWESDRFADTGARRIWHKAGVVVNLVVTDADPLVPVYDACAWWFAKRRGASWVAWEDDESFACASFGHVSLGGF